MTEKGKSMWLKFFRSAGIPSGFDTKYAVVFDENRIKMDMLMDLNKECLRDMGITAMGDIIAILKHARIVHETSKEQDFETAKPSSSSNVKTTTKSVVASQKSFIDEGSSSKPSASTDMLSNKVNYNIQVNSTSSTVPRKTVVALKKVTSPPHSRLQASSEEMSDTGSLSPPKVSQASTTSVTKKIIILKKRGTSDLEGREVQREEVPVQKKVRVLPEHEGSYKIKMPEGNTPRTQKLLQSRLGPSPSSSAAAEKKSNVFDRLGGEKSSSSSSNSSSSKSSSQSRQDYVAESEAPVRVSRNASIFDRLGGRQGSSGGVTSSTSQSQLIRMNDDDFMQTKFQIRRQIDSTVTSVRPKPDPSVYREKTLTTIPSRIYSPAKSQPSSSRPTNRLIVRSEVKPVIDNKLSSGIKYRLGLSRQHSPPPSTSRRNEPSIKYHSHSSDVDSFKESNLSTSMPKRSSKVIASAIVKRGSELYDRATTTGEIIKEERIQGESGKFFLRKTIIKRKNKPTSK